MNHSNKVPHHALFPLFGLCVLFVLLGAITAHATTYYVSTAGNDSNPGTLSQPFKSFAQGVSKLQPGDTLYIRGGLYTERIDLAKPNKTGTEGNYITIAGYPGETITIRYADTAEHTSGAISARGNRGYFIFENLVIDAVNGSKYSGWAIRDGNHHFILRNIEIKNQKYNGLYISANDVQIINCKIHDAMPASTIFGQGSFYYGIYAHDGSNILIDGNEVYHNSGGGIHAYPGPIDNLVIRNNSVHDNNFVFNSKIGGIITYGNPITAISNTQIYNNLVYNNGSDPSAGNATGIRIDASNVKVWHNTVYGNNRYGITVGTNMANVVVQNNIIYNNADGNLINASPGTIYDHNLATDPKFLRADAFDFRLHPYSPAIRRGVTLNEVSTDIRGRSRWKGLANDRKNGAEGIYDIGAYAEDILDSKSPNPPQNVSAR